MPKPPEVSTTAVEGTQSEQGVLNDYTGSQVSVNSRAGSVLRQTTYQAPWRKGELVSYKMGDELHVAGTVDLGNKFICSHQGRMQHFLGREIITPVKGIPEQTDSTGGQVQSNELYLQIFSNEKYRFVNDDNQVIQQMFDRLPDNIKERKKIRNTFTDGCDIYDYLMCSSYIKFKNCAILCLTFTPSDGKTELKISLEYEGELSKLEIEKIKKKLEKGKKLDHYWRNYDAASDDAASDDVDVGVAGAVADYDDVDVGHRATRYEYGFREIKVKLDHDSGKQLSGKIYIMRHGYGAHNKVKAKGTYAKAWEMTKRNLYDAELDPEGVNQCHRAGGFMLSILDPSQASTIVTSLEGQGLAEYKYFCSDLKRTQQSLAVFNKARGLYADITVLPYIHEFEYKKMKAYGDENAFIRMNFLTQLSDKILVGPVLVSAIAQTAGRVGGIPLSLVKNLGLGLGLLGQGGMMLGTVLSAIPTLGETLDIAQENISPMRKNGIFPINFDLTIPEPTVVIDTFFYSLMKIITKDETFETPKFNLFGILFSYDEMLRGIRSLEQPKGTAGGRTVQENKLAGHRDKLASKQSEFKPFGDRVGGFENLVKRGSRFKNFRNAGRKNQMGTSERIMSGGGRIKRTKRKKTKKTRRKKTSKKNRGTKMRNKKTHNRTKKNKKNKRNP